MSAYVIMDCFFRENFRKISASILKLDMLSTQIEAPASRRRKISIFEEVKVLFFRLEVF